MFTDWKKLLVANRIKSAICCAIATLTATGLFHWICSKPGSGTDRNHNFSIDPAMRPYILSGGL